MGSIIGFITKAILFVASAVLRGIASLLTMAFAAYLWQRVERCRGRQLARPASLLFFPVVAAVIAALFLALDVVRLLLNFSVTGAAMAIVVALVVVPGGIFAGLVTGGRIPLQRTRWGRIVMESTGNHVVFWFAMTVLAIFFLILPYGWLAIPTSGLMLFASLQLIVAQGVLYGRCQQLRVAAAAVVSGPAIDLRLDARGLALVACGMDLWARNGGRAVPAAELSAALQRAGRRDDYALLVTPAVQQAWQALAADSATAAATLQALVQQGVLAADGSPGPQLARLLRMGACTRTMTLAHRRFTAAGPQQQHAVLMQAGGSTLLLAGNAAVFTLREVQELELLALLASL